jgi:hypothetical protein
MLDADGDGVITAAELKAGLEGRAALSAPPAAGAELVPPAPVAASAAADMLFALLDKDGDGVITKAEMSAALGRPVPMSAPAVLQPPQPLDVPEPGQPAWPIIRIEALEYSVDEDRHEDVATKAIAAKVAEAEAAAERPPVTLSPLTAANAVVRLLGRWRASLALVSRWGFASATSAVVGGLGRPAGLPTESRAAEAAVEAAVRLLPPSLPCCGMLSWSRLTRDSGRRQPERHTKPHWIRLGWSCCR